MVGRPHLRDVFFPSDRYGANVIRRATPGLGRQQTFDQSVPRPE